MKKITEIHFQTKNIAVSEINEEFRVRDNIFRLIGWLSHLYDTPESRREIRHILEDEGAGNVDVGGQESTGGACLKIRVLKDRHGFILEHCLAKRHSGSWDCP